MSEKKLLLQILDSIETIKHRLPKTIHVEKTQEQSEENTDYDIRTIDYDFKHLNNFPIKQGDKIKFRNNRGWCTGIFIEITYKDDKFRFMVSRIATTGDAFQYTDIVSRDKQVIYKIKQPSITAQVLI